MEYTADTPILGTGTLTPLAIDAAFRQRGPRAAPRYAPDGVYREWEAGGRRLRS